MPEYIRQSSIPLFFEAGAGQKVLAAVREAVLTEVSAAFSEVVDPNWSQFEIEFEPEDLPNFLTRAPHDEGSCRLAFDFTPCAARVKGPLHGVTDVTVDVPVLLSEPLLAILRLFCQLQDEYTFSLDNPAHEIKLIPGRTLLTFDDGTRGVVESVGDSVFDVVRGKGRATYDLGILHREIAGDAGLHTPRATGVLYADCVQFL